MHRNQLQPVKEASVCVLAAGYWLADGRHFEHDLWRFQSKCDFLLAFLWRKYTFATHSVLAYSMTEVVEMRHCMICLCKFIMLHFCQMLSRSVRIFISTQCIGITVSQLNLCVPIVNPGQRYCCDVVRILLGRGDHLSAKPGGVKEFDIRRRNVR